MFEDEEVADNVEEEKSEQPASPADSVDQTKAFATRLKQEKAKAKQEVRQEIAESFGYDTWDAYLKAQTDNKLLDKGLDPESVRPLLKDLIREDPEYVEAMKFKAEKEDLEKELFATNSIRDLNARYGTNYKSVNELDPETIKMWNEGTPLEKAYAANNLDSIVQAAVKKASAKRDTGKEHLTNPTADNAIPQATKKVVNDDQLAVFNAFGFTREEAEEYLNRRTK